MLIFSFSLIISLVITPLFRKLAIHINLIDKPSEQQHKKHKSAIPLMGGAAMCTTWCITLLLGILSPSALPLDQLPQTIIDNLTGLAEVTPKLIIIIVGGILITLLGFIDDKYNMCAKTKFFGQVIIVALVVIFADIKITLFIQSNIIHMLVTILWIVIIINAINLFDNMDGLAVGISSIAFFFFTAAALIFNHYFVASLGAVGLGTSLGFWFYNHSPASIFMGDSGSHFLGYILGITSAYTTYFQQGITLSYLSVLIPVFIMALPLFDLLSVIAIRLKIRKPIYIGDNNHISHRFCNMGMTRKTSVLCIHILAVIIGLSVLPLLWGDEKTTIVCFIQACTILLLISIIQFAARKE